MGRVPSPNPRRVAASAVAYMTLPVRDARSQANERLRWKNESVIDRRIPLAFPSHGHPESGLSVTAFYARKHAPGGPGKGTYWPLHLVESFGRRKQT